jgi:hypothetical protein
MSAHPGPFEGTPVADAAVLPAPLRVNALAKVRARLRRRAIFEGVVLGLGVAAVPLPFANPHDALLAAIAAAGAAIVIFLARRSNDLAVYAREARARARGIEAAGLPLRDWHAGAPLAAWSERGVNRELAA